MENETTYFPSEGRIVSIEIPIQNQYDPDMPVRVRKDNSDLEAKTVGIKTD